MKHIIFQGPRDSGKTAQANKLTRILFEDEEVLTTYATGNKNLAKYLAYLQSGNKALIIDECESLEQISNIDDYIADAHFSEDTDYMLIFITQADCSNADSNRFRVLECSYSTSREEYIIEPLTVSEKAPGTEPPAAP